MLLNKSVLNRLQIAGQKRGTFNASFCYTMAMKRPDKTKTRLHSFALPCKGKKQFETKQEASEAADFHMLENMNIDLSVYQCDRCHYWHMTRRNNDEFHA